ncbi:uncharacterized protein TNCV_2309281 [Trichonephila clavipes]|nr:uncharacterized protein TNCV_2309281 [Trichonephila clavipes]
MVKVAITKASVLKFPDFNKPFELFTDACSIGLGAVLNQEQRPVVFARTLSAAERNYTVTERECFAVVWALNKFRTYLGSLPIKVITDHAALTHLTTADVLSRNPIESKIGGPERKVQKGSEHRVNKRDLSSNDYNSVLPRLRKKNRKGETVTPTTSGYNLRPGKGKREESRLTIEMKTQQGGPVRSRKGRERNDSPYIEERTRSSSKNARRGGDQQRQDQEKRGTCTKKSFSLEVLVGNANYKSLKQIDINVVNNFESLHLWWSPSKAPFPVRELLTFQRLRRKVSHTGQSDIYVLRQVSLYSIHPIVRRQAPTSPTFPISTTGI